MKPAPEYALAAMLIEHLSQDAELAPAVLEAPFDHADQGQNIALAAGQHDFSVAVQPLPPELPGNKQERTGRITCRLAVLVFTTRQGVTLSAPGHGTGAALAASVAGHVLHRCMCWQPEGSGIPYTEPEVSAVEELNLSELPDLANLTGSCILLSKDINHKQYYSTK